MLSALINRITEYVKIKGQQIKLEIIGHVAKLLGHVLVVSFIAILGLFLILFLSFAVGAYLNELFESTYLGYLAVAGGYFLVVIIIALLARTGRIQKWIETLILSASDELEEDE